MRKHVVTLLVSFLILTASSALAAPMGFNLVISNPENSNTPYFYLTNTGTLDITYFKMTIGDTSYNFDFVNDIVTDNVSYSLITPDYYVNGGKRPDTQEFSFSDFKSGWTINWLADVDIDNSNTVEDYQKIFFNNGDAPNSVVTVTFAGGKQLEGTWPDADPADSYTMNVSSVPVPAAVWLLGSGLAGLFGLRRKLS